MNRVVLHPPRLHVFSDFDGTITDPDTLLFLAEHLGGGLELYRENGRLLRDGRMSLRDATAREMACLRAPFSEAAPLLRAHVRVDPGFATFARWCAEHRVPLTVLSAGFHEIVELFLEPADFPLVEVRANRFAPGTWQCVFRDESPHGHDKVVSVRAARAHGQTTVYVGDGLSDREPAAVADVVFARRGGALAEHCRTHGIAHAEFDAFDDVLRAVRARVPSAA